MLHHYTAEAKSFLKLLEQLSSEHFWMATSVKMDYTKRSFL